MGKPACDDWVTKRENIWKTAGPIQSPNFSKFFPLATATQSVQKIDWVELCQIFHSVPISRAGISIFFVQSNTFERAMVWPAPLKPPSKKYQTVIMVAKKRNMTRVDAEICGIKCGFWQAKLAINCFAWFVAEWFPRFPTGYTCCNHVVPPVFVIRMHYELCPCVQLQAQIVCNKKFFFWQNHDEF